MNEKNKSLQEKIHSDLNLRSSDFESYGNFAVKLNESYLSQTNSMPMKGSLVLVTGITPTPAGEGKTTTAIALADALQTFRKTSVCLRQASLGPFFGVKGGATGGGLADLSYPNKTNLHFTGDFHAISTAHNLIAALIDNHIYQGNILDFDSKQILWKRTIDMNDRTLRQVQIGIGKGNGPQRTDEFLIVAASEIMAAFCLAIDLKDLLQRLQKIGIGFTSSNKLIRLGELQASEALALLLEDAIRPNITLTRAGTPCYIHGGPFANIAHGCSSLRATRAALSNSEIVVTEAGFGSDLGAEKFINIKTPLLKTKPKLAVLVASLKALKFHGGQAKSELGNPNLEFLRKGLANLDHHIHLIENLYGLPCLVSLNVFDSDTEKEFELIEEHLSQMNIPSARCYGYSKGADGARGLAEKVLSNIESSHAKSTPPIYSNSDSIIKKLEQLAMKIHGASGIELSIRAKQDLEQWGDQIAELPICLAKTPFSLTADPKKGGLPQLHTLPIERILPSFGAGFVVVTTGEIMLMPGLPKSPRGVQI